MSILNKEIDNEDQRELGPLKYLAATTGKDMNQVVNWFLLMIIFVFDPLAIALVVAANMAFAQIKPKIKMSVPEGMEFNKKYAIPKSWPNPEINEEDLIVDDLELKRRPIEFEGPFVVEKSLRSDIPIDDIYGEDNKLKRGL